MAGVAALVSFGVLQAFDEIIFKPRDMSCMCPPLAAVAVLLFSLPNAPASSPRNVIAGHLVSTFVAYLVVNYGPIAYLRPLATAGAIAAMAITGTTHPPAGAYAYLYVDKGMGLMGMLTPGLTGALILVACQQLWLLGAAMYSPIAKKTD
eukprot:CAMPEP_0119308506 /NCGR_PEP_ID=MMETSP1333-20130426/11418_1 /TAXON_ID=418940 /ORGANISM="Scyphosphaera apsteinii, Strain RCC1455" /LENGTH=149 /DNA_ID=CAMNT_0007312301 /DNA_START=36 /DNA_END=485 /DNA_ORIENTATION=+